MNKLACLLLFPFAATQPLAPTALPAAPRPLGSVVLPAAPPADWSLLAARWRGPATTRPSAIRALGRLLRAYAEPRQPESAPQTTTGAPFPPVAGYRA
ncbi:hypothetical protein LJ737_17415 [Hymenobacter sp. 15J16-1T3B]|uniref:hypothetical protein n=1 Tax=Hymenobacter sp. 15J16-1T3B TaxID=2886941 RepID=UPI001D118AFD|nr:hypothetical protein [Hymenobacter sp. 15J16-1T3B]MCC3159026.1 hypothetical protein [Hymenobacter sp. 15J16-1T3B]